MGRSVILYRGSLKSCNYRCSYCPFSKQKGSEKERREDKAQWFRFVERVEEGMGQGNFQTDFGGVMVTPYGEALLYPWYWEGLARLSRLKGIDVVGAQTNLSFPEEKSLACFGQAGGDRGKLRLWATFHPEMVSVGAFAETCIRLKQMGITLCAGAVGVPGQEGVLRELKKMLPADIYLWINKMDGLGRKYTEEEKKAFEEIDPYVWREWEVVPADVGQCRGRVFVDGGKGLRICNISQNIKAAEYQWQQGEVRECKRKACSCYLAYGGRDNWMNQVLFGPYPVLRIPRKAKAVFLDIEGTLLPKGDAGKVEEEARRRVRFLETLSKEGALLFFATTLPYGEAIKRCRDFSHWFCGGVFAGGAHVALEQKGEKKAYFFPLDESCLAAMEAAKKELGFRLLVYRNGKSLYKMTLVRPARKPWGQEEAGRLASLIDPKGRCHIRWILEGNCLQIVAAKANKANGVRLICQWLGIAEADIAAAGDTKEDEEMMKIGADCQRPEKPAAWLR